MPRRARAPAIAALGLLLGLALVAPAGSLATGRTDHTDRTSVRQAGLPSRVGQRDSAPALTIPLASGTLGHRLRHYFSRSSTLVLLGVLVLCSLVLVLLRRRATRPHQRRRNRTADEQ